MPRYKASVNASPREAYRLKWLSKKEFKKYKPRIDEINFYDDAIEEDVLVPLNKSNLKFDITPRGGKDTYEICFSGVIEFELSPKQRKALEKRDFSIDYLMMFLGPGDHVAESDQDYELVENTNITLGDFEAL